MKERMFNSSTIFRIMGEKIDIPYLTMRDKLITFENKYRGRVQFELFPCGKESKEYTVFVVIYRDNDIRVIDHFGEEITYGYY